MNILKYLFPFRIKHMEPNESLTEPRYTSKAMTELDRLADFARHWLWEEALKIAQERSGDSTPVIVSEEDVKQLTIGIERNRP